MEGENVVACGSGRQYLEPASHRRGWLVNNEVAGRFVWSDEQPNGGPTAFVVHGRLLTWEEFGEALESYEVWKFRLVIEDRIDDARVDGGLIEELLRSGQPIRGPARVKSMSPSPLGGERAGLRKRPSCGRASEPWRA